MNDIIGQYVLEVSSTPVCSVNWPLARLTIVDVPIKYDTSSVSTAKILTRDLLVAFITTHNDRIREASLHSEGESYRTVVAQICFFLITL